MDRRGLGPGAVGPDGRREVEGDPLMRASPGEGVREMPIELVHRNPGPAAAVLPGPRRIEELDPA